MPARDFSAELYAAREAQDWDAHERIWEERRVYEVQTEGLALQTSLSEDDVTALVALFPTEPLTGSAWERRATRYVIRAIWPAGAIEDHAYFGDKDKAKAHARKRVKAGGYRSAVVIDRQTKKAVL